MAKKSNTVELNVWQHSITVTDSTIVHVHHKSTCGPTCSALRSILDYLEAELFVEEGYITNEVVEDE